MDVLNLGYNTGNNLVKTRPPGQPIDLYDGWMFIFSLNPQI